MRTAPSSRFLDPIFFSSALAGALAVPLGCTPVVPATGNMGGGSGGKSGDAAVFDVPTHEVVNADTAMPGGDGPDGACAATTTSAMLVPLDLYVMMDSSRSMNETTANGKSKWDTMKTALTAFFNDPSSANLGVGLQFFPLEENVAATCAMDGDCGTFGPCDRRKLCVNANTSNTSSPMDLCADNSECGMGQVCALLQQCTTSSASGFCTADGTAKCGTDCMAYTGYCHGRDVCDAGRYATPTVAVGTLPGVAGDLTSALGAHGPGGYTPTGPALAGALQYARQRATDFPDHKVAVLLVTDGLPGGFSDLYDEKGVFQPGIPRALCNPYDIPSIAALASAESGKTPSVPTFVIGVFDNDSKQTAQPNLDAIASAGGTKSAIVVSTSTSDVTNVLQSALNTVRSSTLACQYKIPSGVAVDFGKVNVQFTPGSGSPTPIGYVPTKGDCGSKLGWYYDVDPATGGTPTVINACDASCTKFQGDSGGHVDILLGCKTIPIT